MKKYSLLYMSQLLHSAYGYMLDNKQTVDTKSKEVSVESQLVIMEKARLKRFRKWRKKNV